VSVAGYDPDDPDDRAGVAWDMPEDLRRCAMHALAWAHPEVFAEVVAEAMYMQADKDRFYAAFWAEPNGAPVAPNG
jgi:hypothetical protein